MIQSEYARMIQRVRTGRTLVAIETIIVLLCIRFSREIAEGIVKVAGLD